MKCECKSKIALPLEVVRVCELALSVAYNCTQNIELKPKYWACREIIQKAIGAELSSHDSPGRADEVDLDGVPQDGESCEGELG